MKTTTLTYEITIHTPVHIGSGEKVTKLDYIIYNGKIHFIDNIKFTSYLKQKNKVDNYIKFVSKNDKNAKLKKWISDENLDIDEITNKYVKRSIEIPNFHSFNGSIKNDVATCLKDVYGRPYISGSTIKGIIVSSLIDYKLKSINTTELQKQKFWNHKDKLLNNELFKTAFGEDYKKILSSLSVSDSTQVRDDDIVFVQKLDFSTINKKAHKISVWRECIKKETKLTFNINLIGDEFKKEVIEEALKYRFEMIYGENGVIGKRYADINVLLPKERFTEDIVFSLGGGAGFQTKTNVVAIYKDVKNANDKQKYFFSRGKNAYKAKNNEVISPRAIKLAHNKVMGICSLKCINEKVL